MSGSFHWPGLRKILPDVFAFAIGLGTAWFLKWQTADLVWSLWLCSLVLGYLTILSTIGAGVYIGIRLLLHKEFPRKMRVPAILIGSAVALFFLGFFSLHFCGFHAGHAGFLCAFFPIEGMKPELFFDAFMNPVLLWKTVFRHLLGVYGFFLIPAIIAERKHVFASMVKAIRTVREGIDKRKAEDFMKSAGGKKQSLQDPFFSPYLNVIRMHLLIFFFGFCHMLKIDSFFVSAVVYFVYFFPWRAFRTPSEKAA